MVKVAKFITVGMVVTIFGYGLYILLVQSGFHYQFALALDYIFGVFIGYILNRYWTFASSKKNRLSFIKYVMIYIGIYFSNVVLLSIVVEMTTFGPIFGQFISLGVVTLLSYLVQNNWVFKES
ncbi:GtrA family protein [bacterium]|jgi:putative flippase GtrA|nr:GtrA family protein [bacterium]